MKQKIYQFMYGRNGFDQFSRALTWAAVILLLLDAILGNTGFLYGIGLVVIIYAYYRVFSRKLEKRRAENAKYMQWQTKATAGFANWRERMRQRKDYCFFRCPSCRSMLRVPRGKGKIRVTCRKCGNAFERKT